MRANQLVVVSFYEPRPLEPLADLLRSLRRFDAGLAWDLAIVVNRIGTGPLKLPREAGSATVLERPNEGMNIGAWDHGWRSLAGYSGYLFLQDECSARADGWLHAFVEAGAREGVGLVGESWNAGWDRPWETMREAVADHALKEHVVAGQPANRVDVYRSFMAARGVPEGAKAGHMRSLAWYLRRSTLERMGGFLHGADYGECIAAEIAATKQVEQLGLRAVQVGDQPFARFRHVEWREVAPGKWRHVPAAPPPPPSSPGIFGRLRMRLGL